MTDCDPVFRERVLTYDLLEGEEASAFEAHLALCPGCRGRVRLIRRAEERLRTLREAIDEAHPTPDDLYDFAGGPGAVALDPEKRAPTEAHLRRCPACAREV